MSEIEPGHDFPHLFIWYLAPAAMEPLLRQWLREVEKKLGIKGELFLRSDTDSEGKVRTTFMETYRDVDNTFITNLEALAAQQPWNNQLLTARRCEAFNRIE
ncbi:DUF4936 family protein [Pseudomonadota bacterium]